MTLWDQNEKFHDSISGQALCWRSYTQGDMVFSIPQYVEENAEHLRAKYAAFIHDLGESYIGSKRVIDYLDVGTGFSLWWMNELSEKSPFKSPRIYDCIRLLALEEILLDKKPSNLMLVSSDIILAQAIQKLCCNTKIKFVWKKCKKNKPQNILLKIYNSLPFSLRGLISFKYILMHWQLRKIQKPKWFSGDNSIFLCSYFFNLDPILATNGRFYSRQWEGLPEFLHGIGKNTNWIHHFLKSPGIPNTQIGLKWVDGFNSDATNQGSHSFIETYMTWKVILKAIKGWLWLNIISWRLRKVYTAFTPKNSSVCLWPLLSADWKTSLTGSRAFKNCLLVELFDSIFSELPHQEIGLYLWENQGWETAMIHAWKRHGHGKIIGVPHATVVFWHLNNFDDSRTLNSNNKCAKPIPDLLAVNGPMAWKAFIGTSYPVENLVEVEALRFQYLLKLGSVTKYNEYVAQSKENSEKIGYQKNILILGDFTISQTKEMLHCFEQALKLVNTDISVTFKAHPACLINIEDYPTFPFDITDKPLVEIVGGFDVVFSSNTTSAGLDALLVGLRVIVFLDGNDFNHSPLRGIKGVEYVSSDKELAEVLLEDVVNIKRHSIKDFFWLDEDFTKWRKLFIKLEGDNLKSL